VGLDLQKISAANCKDDLKVAPIPALVREYIRSTMAAEEDVHVLVVRDEKCVFVQCPISKQMRLVRDVLVNTTEQIEQLIAERTAANIAQALMNEGLVPSEDAPKPKRRM
jgi:hypothetical protein